MGHPRPDLVVADPARLADPQTGVAGAPPVGLDDALIACQRLISFRPSRVSTGGAARATSWPTGQLARREEGRGKKEADLQLAKLAHLNE